MFGFLKFFDPFRTWFHIQRFLRQVRLDAARALLHGNGVRVSEAAVEVGFESPHFTREFKRQFGVSPSRLRVPGQRLSS